MFVHRFGRRDDTILLMIFGRQVSFVSPDLVPSKNFDATVCVCTTNADSAIPDFTEHNLNRYVSLHSLQFEHIMLDTLKFLNLISSSLPCNRRDCGQGHSTLLSFTMIRIRVER